MADASGERATRGGTPLATLLACLALFAVPVRCGAEEIPDPSAGGAGARILVLPSIRAAGAGEVSPWTAPPATARFARLEEALASALGEAGYTVSGPAAALAKSAARAALSEAGVPLTPAGAAEIARAAGADVALVVRADAIRTTGGATSSLRTTDALVEASAYRARDGLRLARTTIRVTGSGKDQAEADAEALAHAARPLAAALVPPLAAALDRPVLEVQGLSITLEGSLNWREYRRVLDLILREIPEMEALEERRLSRGRFELLGRCRCKAEDAAQRLDGLRKGGFQLTAKPQRGGFRVQVAPVATAKAPPPAVSGGLSP